MPSSYGGFVFCYYAPDEEGNFQEIVPTPDLKEVEDMVVYRFAELLQGRQDLLNLLVCLPEGVEIRMYVADELTEGEKSAGFVGRTTKDGEQLVLEFAVGETVQGLKQKGDGFEVVAHELAHVLDFLIEGEGLGWSGKDLEIFKKAKSLELERLKQGKSPLVDYALESDEEFLAVLVETFFEKPAELRQSNEALYLLLREFFRQDPELTS